MSAPITHHRSAIVSTSTLSHRAMPLPAFGAALSLTLMLAGCNGAGTGGKATPKPAATPTPVIATCQANPSWITTPQMPAEVATAESFCDFYQFSWQWFLAQVSPSNPTDPNSERVFESNRLHVPNADGKNNDQARGL